MPAGSPLFKIGNLLILKSNPETVFPVIGVVDVAAEPQYIVFQDNQQKKYYESQVELSPEKSPELDVIETDLLRAHLTSYQILSPSLNHLFSLKSGKIQFVPYQYRPVLKILSSDTPRLLIADEVGVGKTIETGLIIKELQARMSLKSILVICPKALVAEGKWFKEMKRFDERFTHLDSKQLRHCINETDLDGEWPENYDKSILPFSLIDSEFLLGEQKDKRHKRIGLNELDPPPKFDLVIIDEAHNARNADTYLHQGLRVFCDNAKAVLLLSATPIQLGNQDLYTLLNLLRPDLILDKPTFNKMSEPNKFINEAIKYCRDAKPNWTKQATKSLDKILTTDWGHAYLKNEPILHIIKDQLISENISEEERLVMIRKIEDLYTFGSLINRTRRRDIGAFCLRKPLTVTAEFTPMQKQLHDEILSIMTKSLSKLHSTDNPSFMMTTIQRQVASSIFGLEPLLRGMLEKRLDQLEYDEIINDTEITSNGLFDKIKDETLSVLKKLEKLDKTDPKLNQLIKILKDKSKQEKNKSLLFSTFIHTLDYLYKHLINNGLRVALITGRTPDHDRAKFRARFALPKTKAEAFDVLLSSEVGCEGLDFQFCDLLINYDIPWNPMRIEQRIGRIDRYGQESETVTIVNFVTPGTIEADIYERCLLRIGIFQSSIGAGEDILGDITDEIKNLAEDFKLSENDRAIKLKQLSENKIRDLQEHNELERKDSELFGLNLPSKNWEDDLKKAETFWLSSASLINVISHYLKAKSQNDASFSFNKNETQTIRMNKQMRASLLNDFFNLPKSHERIFKDWEKYLKGNEPTLKRTFDGSKNFLDDGITGLSVLHPLVKQAANYLTIKNKKIVHCEIKDKSLPYGSFVFAVYSWDKRGMKNDYALIPICSDPNIESKLLAALETAEDTISIRPVDTIDIEKLEQLHHSKWEPEQKLYKNFNKQLFDQKKQSYKISFDIRCASLRKQISEQENKKILLMRESELTRVVTKFEEDCKRLDPLSNLGDIIIEPLIYGKLTNTQV